MANVMIYRLTESPEARLNFSTLMILMTGTSRYYQKQFQGSAGTAYKIRTLPRD